MLGIDAVDEGLKDATAVACIGAYMDVAELHNAVAVEGLWQVSVCKFYVYNLHFSESHVGAPKENVPEQYPAE